MKKKCKDARFAACVDRSLIEKGAERLGTPIEELIAETIAGMGAWAAAIDLQGKTRLASLALAGSFGNKPAPGGGSGRWVADSPSGE